MENIQIPTTLPEVENLIHELYKPNSAETISRIQDVLQRLQKSDEGWQLAQGLLACSSDNVKFFGALTIIVKLNTASLSDKDALSVLQNLIAWLINSLGDGSGPIVVRKLCSALVTYFIHYSHTWDRCVRHLLYCLHLNASVPIEDVGDSTPIENIVQALNTPKYFAASWFCTALAEDTEKVDTKSTKYISLHERLLSNAQDVTALMSHSLKPANGISSTEAQKESIVCLQAWALYAQRSPKQPLVECLQTLLQPTINGLLCDELYEPSIELLTDILGDWPDFLTPDQFNSLYSLFESQWSQERYQNLLQGDSDFDAIQFGLFMLAFGAARMNDMMDGKDDRAQSFLAGLAGLLTAQGHPVAEDKIFVPALEFWSAFVEHLVDNLYAESSDNLPWDKPPLSQVMQVVSYSWQKIQYPMIDVYNSWDSAERAGFGDARKDVADFLQSVYTISGLPLVSLFVDLILQALSSSAWAGLEAASFCLGALSDCVPEGGSCDDILNKVFGSSLFALLHQGHSVVPVRARQTCLYLIERYSDYFGRHSEFLPAALNLLFSAVGDRHLALPSSKSIYTLCSSCRGPLTSEVDAFLEQYSSLRNGTELDSVAEERVVGAIASIIQSIPDKVRKAESFRRLLMLIGIDVDNCLRLRSLGEGALVDPNDTVINRAFDITQRPTGPVTAHDVSLQLAIRALRCLCSIAKGFQAPVDLDSDESNGEEPLDPDLDQVQADIMGILIQFRNLFSSNVEVVDVICTILRAGFSETDPGPFVFPPQVVTEFITGDWQNRIATVVNTASVFVTSLSSGKHKQYIAPAISRLLPWVVGLLHQLPEPENEPELSQYGIEFAGRGLAKQPSIVMSQDAKLLEFIFIFAIKLLNGTEPLPKAAAAEFWTTFILLKVDDQNIQATIDNAMSHLGPQLAQSLVQNIGGKASRSELDRLSDPLKKLVVKHVHAQKWLETALNDPSFPSDKVSAQEKTLFLKKIISLRGSRPTNQVVREFWLACRGSNFAYAS
ncbi:armadillo-type protein [Biscogniauxia mediterranea]|nr:armadillo-type protein [Biscogniauxia mediterranea]